MAAPTTTASEVFVAPGTTAQLVVPAARRCHWTVGVGVPVAAARSTTVVPRSTVADDGFVVTFGLTVAGGTTFASTSRPTPQWAVLW